MFKERTSKPEKGNKYYNNKANGGNNPCINGYPLDADCNVLSNCVGYAVGRFNEIAENVSCSFLGNRNAGVMGDLAISQGLKTGKTPALGACAVWKKAGGAGHVAIVERIINDSTIITSESGWGCKKPFFVKKRSKGCGNWGQNANYTFICFIYQKEEIKNMTVKYGDKGENVKTLQKVLKSKKYYNGGIDGICGVLTLGAILAWQKMHGLSVDGIAGTKTLESLGIKV